MSLKNEGSLVPSSSRLAAAGLVEVVELVVMVVEPVEVVELVAVEGAVADLHRQVSSKSRKKLPGRSISSPDRGASWRKRNKAGSRRHN